MTDISRAKVPELLSPAGTPESLRAALAAGADAIYFGASVFSNRMRARNFTLKELKENIRLCHSCGARTHITVNTRIRDREMPQVLSLVDELYSGPAKTRPDALIVADLGLASLIRRNHPSAVLHASTQTSLSSAADIKFLSESGFSRLVLPRELTLREIKEISSNPYGIETEMFIHGALCVSLSGQCLLSYVMGGRSGNRGECAQPCRLPYSCAGSYESDILSLSDLNLASHITEILSSGVSSLKIEGRLRSPEYVFDVTSIYRKLLDERRNATVRESEKLAGAFSRSQTDGYFTSRYSSMLAEKSVQRVSGVSSDKIEEILRSRAESQSGSSEEIVSPTVPLSGHFVLKKGFPVSLELSDGIHSATARGPVPRQADGTPVSAETAYRCLSRLGDTEFSLMFEDLVFDIDDGLWIPSSELNGLRRDAAATLLAKIRCEEEPFSGTPHVFSGEKTFFRSCEIADINIFEEDADRSSLLIFVQYFDRIFVSPENLPRFLPLVSDQFPSAAEKTGIILPVIAPDDGILSAKLDSAKKAGITFAMCHTPGQIRLAINKGFISTGSYRCNVTNSPTCSVYEDSGCDSVILSPELPSGGIRNVGKKLNIYVGCTVYGRIPLMTTARCILCGGKCQKGNTGGRRANAVPHFCMDYMTDRKGERFPVIGSPDCTNIIYNSVPVWMADRMDDIKRNDGRSFHHFIFTTETCRQAVQIISDYDNKRPGEGRRI